MLLTPILPMLMAGAVVQPVDSSPATRVQPVLHTPDAIAPAVLPYLACLYAVRGLPFVRGSDEKQIPVDKNDRDCSATKRSAEADALKALEGKPIPGGEPPTRYVEDALAEMESYVASMPVRQASDKSKQPVIGVPMTMEDEIEPAYHRYDNCLKTQVSYTPVTPATVLTVFRQAMKVCESVRESAVIEAEKALVTKGWDEPTRTKVAESTFTTIDQSWLEMGRQFADLLASRARR